MLAWEIPTEDWERMSVKTGRFKPGTQELEILFSCLPSEWFLETVAERYGKGTYRVQAGPGPYRTKNTTIHVSAEYARDAGFMSTPPMAPPPPDPGQMMAARTASEAVQRGIDPLALAQMLKEAARSAVQEAMTQNQPQQPIMNPMEMFLRGMETANSSMLKSLETAKTMLGMQGGEMVAKEKDWTDVVLELGPSILGTLQQAMKAGPAQQQPPPQPPPQARPVLPLHPTQPPAQPTGAEPMATFPDPPESAIPILNVMKGQAFILKRYLSGPQTAAELAEQLFGLVGPDLEPSVLAAADHVAEHGPGILGHASPEFATQKAAETLVAWARLIRSVEETQP